MIPMAMATRRRPAGLFDVLVLVAATAIGLGIVRSWIAARWSLPSYRDYPNQGPSLIERVSISAWVVLSWMGALLVLRARRPRPPWCRLARQPGIAACIAACVVLLAQVTYTVPREFAMRNTSPPSYMMIYCFNPYGASIGVASAWAVLALGGLWRRPTDWLDGLGRGLGGLLIGSAIAQVVLHFWWHH